MKKYIKLFFILILTIILTNSCKQKFNDEIVPDLTQVISELASPVNLNPDTTKLILKDYFDNVKMIDDIIYPKGLSTANAEITDTMLLIPSDSLNPIDVLKIKTSKGTMEIPVLKSKKIRYTYIFPDPEHKYKSINLVGDINAWNPANTPLKYIDDQWKAELFLEPDRYSYQVVLDGIWQLDPNNNIKVSNGMGGYNSQLTIRNNFDDQLPQLQTDKTEDNSIFLKSNLLDLKYLVMYQNHRIGYEIKGNKLKIKIPDIAKTIKRSYIRAWDYCKNNVSDEIFIPLDSGKVLLEAKNLTRMDKETNILYYVMVDRFKNAKKENDAPLNDPEVSPKADFHGGDIAGVTEMISKGYFKKLGVTTIWLSPIVQNPKGKYGLYNIKGIKSKFSAYHGYWPISFTKIDERFGTSADLEQLVKTAHENNENILLDFVANHVHKNYPFYKKYKDKGWFTNLYLPDGTLNTEKWDEHRLTTWFDVFLPTLNLEKQEVADMLSDSAVYWLDKYDIDGFRHDATKHIPLNFWRILTEKVKKESTKTGKNYYQVGETYGTPELISSYIGSGLLDGQFDFNIYDALIQSILKDDTGFDLLIQKIKQSIKYYGMHNLMGYMTGNQDKERFMALATGDVSMDEDSKYAGWNRKITKKTPEGYSKLALMHTFIMTFPGVPVIYYGDEIGMTGANDPDNRRDMKFDNLNENEQKLFEKVSKLTHLRKNNTVFLFGDLNFLMIKKDIVVYTRKYFDKTAIIFVNNSNKEQEININLDKKYNLENLKSTFGSDFKVDKHKITIKIQKSGSEVLVNN
jgi:glycosidase